MGEDPGTQNNTNSTITEPKPKQNFGKPELPGKPEVKSAAPEYLVFQIPLIRTLLKSLFSLYVNNEILSSNLKHVCNKMRPCRSVLNNRWMMATITTDG